MLLRARLPQRLLTPAGEPRGAPNADAMRRRRGALRGARPAAPRAGPRPRRALSPRPLRARREVGEALGPRPRAAGRRRLAWDQQRLPQRPRPSPARTARSRPRILEEEEEEEEAYSWLSAATRRRIVLRRHRAAAHDRRRALSRTRGEREPAPREPRDRCRAAHRLTSSRRSRRRREVTCAAINAAVDTRHGPRVARSSSRHATRIPSHLAGTRPRLSPRQDREMRRSRRAREGRRRGRATRYFAAARRGGDAESRRGAARRGRTRRRRREDAGSNHPAGHGACAPWPTADGDRRRSIVASVAPPRVVARREWRAIATSRARRARRGLAMIALVERERRLHRERRRRVWARSSHEYGVDGGRGGRQAGAEEHAPSRCSTHTGGSGEPVRLPT